MNKVWKRRWLTGAAACALGWTLSWALGCAPAWAQTAAPTPSPGGAPTTAIARDPLAQFNSRQRSSRDILANPAPAPVAPADMTADQLLANEGFYLEADTVIYDQEARTWTAQGSVEARYQGRVIRAAEVIYNQTNGVVTARGDVQLLNPDGTSEFSPAMTADKDFSAGIALGFSARQQQNAKIAADEAVRLSKEAMALNKAVFTVCDICAPDGTPEEPTWSIQASQVIQDHKRQIIYYKNMVIRVKGLPVLATPVFWHVDPSAKRGSGLLAPKIAFDSRRGFSYEQPYLFVLSPSADLIVSPQINSKVAPLLEGEFRERFYSGEVDGRFGYTDGSQFDSDGRPYDHVTSRSYILAQGAFAPTANWSWGFTAERVTDPLMFQRYNVPNVFDQRGLLAPDDQRLLSEVYAVEQDAKSYASISALSFQGLRPGDQTGTFPLVAPLIEAHWDPDLAVLGGRVRVQGSGVVLDRARDPTTDLAPGEDSRRATLGADWQTNYTFADGVRLTPFANTRGDLYNVDNVSATDTGLHTTPRLLGTVGLDADWPFFRRTGDMTLVLEPLAQFAASPAAVNNRYIPNEDSQIFELDETNLFDANKSPGFDYYEGGLRANVGGRATFRWDDGGSAQLLVGRSLRTQRDTTLPANTSLQNTLSDWVVAGSFAPSPAFSSYARALLNTHTGVLDHLEVGVNGAIARANGFVRYYYDDLDSTTTIITAYGVENVGGKTEVVPTNVITENRSQNVQAGGQVLFTRRWGIVGSANWDLAARVPVREEFGLLYQDECTHWELVYQHDGTYDATQHPTDRIVVRLLLVNLGSSGYQRPDFR